MRIIEGTVDEIVEYQTRTAALSPSGQAAPGTEAVVEPDGNEPPTAVTAEDGLAGDDGFYVQQHIYTRATDPAVAQLVLKYIEQLPAGTKIEIGTSANTTDGWSDYLMIRDDGPQKYGAVAYVLPHSGRITFRLRREDIPDVDDPAISDRNVKPTQKYALRVWLNDESKVPLVVTLTEAALDLVRS